MFSGIGECIRFGTYECALTEDDVTSRKLGEPARQTIPVMA